MVERTGHDHNPRATIIMTDARPHFTVTESAGVQIVEFADRKILEEVSINEIGEAIHQLIGDRPAVKLLISFRNVEHLSSAALGMLITLNKRVGELGGTLKLSDISPPIYEVFKITKLNKLFDIHDVAQHALASF
jgi:anti-sigma B factor antagonist